MLMFIVSLSKNLFISPGNSVFNVSWHVSPLFYPVWDSMHFLDLGSYFLYHVSEVVDYNLLKYFLRSFSSSSRILKIWMLVCLLFQRSLRPSSFHSFFFILPLGSYLAHLFIFYLSYSAIDSFQCIFHFIYPVADHCSLVLWCPY